MRLPFRTTRRTAALIGAAVLVVVAALVAVLLLVPGARGPRVEPVAAAVTTPGTTAPATARTPPPTTPPPTRTAPAPPPASDVRLRVPSVGLDLPVLPLTPRGGVIDRPTMAGAYWIEPYGDPGGPGQPADNTLYIAGHSWTRGAAAFNALMAGAGVGVGAVVSVDTPAGTVDYTVTGTETYAKHELPGAADVWAIVPGSGADHLLRRRRGPRHRRELRRVRRLLTRRLMISLADRSASSLSVDGEPSTHTISQADHLTSPGRAGRGSPRGRR